MNLQNYHTRKFKVLALNLYTTYQSIQCQLLTHLYYTWLHPNPGINEVLGVPTKWKNWVYGYPKYIPDMDWRRFLSKFCSAFHYEKSSNMVKIWADIEENPYQSCIQPCIQPVTYSMELAEPKPKTQNFWVSTRIQ